MTLVQQPVGSFSVRIPAFSGPLDLLLHLIQRNELDITAISLVAVTQQYLEHLDTLRENRVERLSDFLVIGARLLVIKSRALLPETPLDRLDEEEDDPAEILARQLRLYKRFRESAEWLAAREHAGFRTYLRVAPMPQLDRKLREGELDKYVLVAALKNALERAAMREDSVSVAVKERRVTIEQQIGRLRREVHNNGHVYFNELLSQRASWLEITVTLLAVLELIKRREVTALQPVLFGPIKILPATST